MKGTGRFNVLIDVMHRLRDSTVGNPWKHYPCSFIHAIGIHAHIYTPVRVVLHRLPCWPYPHRTWNAEGYTTRPPTTVCENELPPTRPFPSPIFSNLPQAWPARYVLRLNDKIYRVDGRVDLVRIRAVRKSRIG